MTDSTNSLSSLFLVLRRQIDGLENDVNARERHMRSEAEQKVKACKEGLEYEIVALRTQLHDKEVSAESEIARLRAQLQDSDNQAPRGLVPKNALEQQLTYQTSLSDAYLAQLTAAKDELRNFRGRVSSDEVMHRQLAQRLENDKALRSLVVDVKYGIATGSELTVFQGLLYQAMVTDPENEARRIATRLLIEDTETSFLSTQERTQKDNVIMKDMPLLSSTNSASCMHNSTSSERLTHTQTPLPMTRRFLKVKKGEPQLSLHTSKQVNGQAPASSPTHFKQQSTKMNNTSLELISGSTLPTGTSTYPTSSSRKPFSQNTAEQATATHTKMVTEVPKHRNHPRAEAKSSHDHITDASRSSQTHPTSLTPPKTSIPDIHLSTIPNYNDHTDIYESPKSLISAPPPPSLLPSDSDINNRHVPNAKHSHSSHSASESEPRTPALSGAKSTSIFMPQTPPSSDRRLHQTTPKTPSSPTRTTPKSVSIHDYNNSPGVLFTPLSQRRATVRPSTEGQNCIDDGVAIGTPSRTSASGSGPPPAYSSLAASLAFPPSQAYPSSPALKEETPPPTTLPTKRTLFPSTPQSTSHPPSPPSHPSSHPKKRHRDSLPSPFSPRTQRVLDEIQRKRDGGKRRRVEVEVVVETRGKGKGGGEMEGKEREIEVVDLVGDE